MATIQGASGRPDWLTSEAQTSLHPEMGAREKGAL